MKLKKYITLALAALTMVCTLAACAPNVEHRFDVNEYSAQAEATMRSISQQLAQMDSLLAVHNECGKYCHYPGRPERLGRPPRAEAVCLCRERCDHRGVSVGVVRTARQCVQRAEQPDRRTVGKSRRRDCVCYRYAGAVRRQDLCAD